MYFNKLSLRGFRNYVENTVEFHPKINIITGKNAQGKTNLLEGLSLMSMGKSFRTGRDNEMIGFDMESCRVVANFTKDGLEREIQIELNRGGKRIRVDGIPKEKNADLLGNVYLVVFSPEDLKIVKEDPEKRRRFMDRELCQIRPMYYRNLGRYKKALIQRNNLLKKGNVRSVEIEPWDDILADYGTKLIGERRDFINKLNRISKDLHYRITGGKERLDLVYESSIPLEDSVAEQRITFLSILDKERSKDAIRGSTGFGPHRDDIKLSVDGIDVRHFGSQGQQRTAALSLKLAELGIINEETGENAVLLLDDVFSELDGDRQEFLIKNLKDNQLFITTADLSEKLIYRLSDYKVLHVEGGRVTE
ncbi:MAG: DNA replication/repair protein RecF [Anaerovoracaceae bacterium]|jgi:DNA replication and repair protein RecF